jgi:hypothetical protein
VLKSLEQAKLNFRQRRLWRKVAAFLMKASAAALVLSSFVPALGLAPQAAVASSSPNILNYQARITDTVGVVVPDGPLPVVLKIWDAALAGNCVYVTRGTCGSPVTFSATTTNGVFSMSVGDATMNSLPANLFDSGSLWLGVTIGGDSEMTPRKLFTSVPYAFSANLIDGLTASATGSVAAYIPATSASGLLTITGDPTSANAVITANPAAAQVSAGDLLLALKNDGANRLTVDVDGHTVASGTLTVNSLDISPTGNIFNVANSDNSARYLTVSSTSTTVGGALAVTGNLSSLNGVVMSWPSSQGGSNTYLKNDGTGNLSWTSVATGSATLNEAFAASTPGAAEITVNATQGALTIADAAGGLGANLFDIQSNGNTARYFSVSATSTQVGGNLAVTGTTTLSSLTASQMVATDASNNLVSITGTAGQLLLGTSGAPAFATMSGDATINSSGAVTLASTGVSANAYGTASSVGQFSVDATGRVTSATTTSIAIDASQVTSGTLATSLLGSGTANSTTFLRGDNTWATVTSGGGNVVDTLGDTLTAGNNAGGTGMTNLGNVGIGATNGTARLTVQDALASPTGNIFQVANANDSARYLTVSSTSTQVGGALAVTGTVTASSLTASQLVATDASKNLVSITGTAGQLLLGTSGAPAFATLSGDATINSSGAVTLASAFTGTPGAYGDASHVGQFSVDAKGRVTSATTTAIAISAS